MTFNVPSGTRGARQPKASAFLRLMNNAAMKRVRRKGGRVMGMNALVLHTVGARSGAERATPLAWFPGEDGSRLIAASAAGAQANPAWYHNLAANPDKVHIEIDGGKVPVDVEQLHGAEREAAWKTIVTATARFAQYQEKTDREIPVIRLTPRAE
ncbi:nitroreductase [Actinophytocola xinjiangensis]|uniref:Nitroreductase n=1 Tax=Actinophytocola xinjiangensis TaxID=485602 RepID=A0A7Z0WH53_9PSEU|nr:nitroreductase/quinone reductase family protein [Actinophytocola xinjiangensis]OLF07152.1 nitroreductase [Actinophytocola xinjiangensis]